MNEFVILIPPYCFIGINPLIPISTTASPFKGSNVLLPSASIHSKLLLMESETIMVISEVSFPVITNGAANWPVTRHEPAGIGEDANIGLGTVVAPAGACPERKIPTPDVLASKAQ